MAYRVDITDTALLDAEEYVRFICDIQQEPAARRAGCVADGTGGCRCGRTNQNPFGRSDRILLGKFVGGRLFRRGRDHP